MSCLLIVSCLNATEAHNYCIGLDSHHGKGKKQIASYVDAQANNFCLFQSLNMLKVHLTVKVL